MKFKLSLKKINISRPAVLKLLPIGTLVIIVLVLTWLVNFLYVYFYNTLTQAEEIYIYRSQISLKTIDINLYNDVFLALENKKEFDQKTLTSLGNPFSATEKPILKPELLPDEETAENGEITPVQ